MRHLSIPAAVVLATACAAPTAPLRPPGAQDPSEASAPEAPARPPPASAAGPSALAAAALRETTTRPLPEMGPMPAPEPTQRGDEARSAPSMPGMQHGPHSHPMPATRAGADAGAGSAPMGVPMEEDAGAELPAPHAAHGMAAPRPDAETQAHEDAGVPTLFTCTMHPEVQQPGPGRCPKCGMRLVPIRSAAADGGTR